MPRAFNYFLHSLTITYLFLLYCGFITGEEVNTEHGKSHTEESTVNCTWQAQVGGNLHFSYKGKLIDKKIGNEYREGTQMTYTSWYCASGYSLTNNQSRYCQSDGAWNGTEPKCVRTSGEIKESSSHWILIWACLMSITSVVLTIALCIICYKHVKAHKSRNHISEPHRYDVVRRVHSANRFSTIGHSDIVRESLVQSPYQDLSVRLVETDDETYFQPFDMLNLPSPTYVEVDRVGVDIRQSQRNP